MHLGSTNPLGVGDPYDWICRPCGEEE